MYAGLDWGSFELLIPQDDISDAKLDLRQDNPVISIDKAVERAFGPGSLPQPAAGEDMQSVLIIRGKSYGTVLMPHVVRLDGGQEELPACRILAPSFERHGLRPAGFSGSKISYVVDIEKFITGRKI